MMRWYWKVRIYHPGGNYGVCQIETGRDLREIDIRQDFYKELTGEKMLLEGMSESEFSNIPQLNSVFISLWNRA